MTTNQNPANAAFDQDAITTVEAARDLRARVERDHADNDGAVHVAQMIWSTLMTADNSRLRIAHLAESLQRTAKRIAETAAEGGHLGRSDANTDVLDSLRRELQAHDADMASVRRLVVALNAILATK